MDCFVPRNDGAGCNDNPFRHCEAHSAVAIHVPEPMPRWIASFLSMNLLF
jgi:hypothetical protein